MILNQYWGQTQSVLGATLLEGNPILKIREGYVGISDVDAFSEVLEKSPTSVSQNLGDGSSWLNLNNIKTNDDSYSVCNIPGQNFAVDIDQDLNAVSVYGPLYSGYRTGQAQSFFSGQTKLLYQCSFWLRRYGVTTGDLYASFYNDSGSSYGINSKPGTSFYALSASRSYATISSSSFTEYSFDFSGSSPVYILPNVKYCVAIGFSGGGPSSYIGVGFEESNGHSGNASVFVTGIGWTPRGNLDVPFTVSEVGTTGSLTTSIGAYSNGFSLPSSFLINGIEVGIKVGVSCGAGEYIKDNTIQLRIDGINYSAENKSNGTTLVGGATYIVYGGISEFWGETWGVSNINNSDFGPYIRFVGRGTALIDHVYTKVYYLGETTGIFTKYSDIGRFSVNNIDYSGYNGQQLNLMLRSEFSNGLGQINTLSMDWYKKAQTKTVSFLKSASEELVDFSYDNISDWGVTGGRLINFNLRSGYTTVGLTSSTLSYLQWKDVSSDSYTIKFGLVDAYAYFSRAGAIVNVNQLGAGKEKFVLCSYNFFGGVGGSYMYRIDEYYNGVRIGGACYGSYLESAKLGPVSPGGYNIKVRVDNGVVDLYAWINLYPGDVSGDDRWARRLSYTPSLLKSGGVGFCIADGISTSGTPYRKPGFVGFKFEGDGDLISRDKMLKSILYGNNGKAVEDNNLLTGTSFMRLFFYDDTWVGESVSRYWQTNYEVTEVSYYTGQSNATTFKELYLVTGNTFSDFVFSCEAKSNIDAVSYPYERHMGIVVGRTENYYAVTIPQNAEKLVGASEFIRYYSHIDKRVGSGISSVSSLNPRIPGMLTNQWTRVDVIKQSNNLELYLNGSYLGGVGMTWPYDESFKDVFVGIGFNFYNVTTNSKFYLRNVKIYSLKDAIDSINNKIGDNYGGIVDRFLPNNYFVRSRGETLEFLRRGTSYGVADFDTYNRIAETKNYGRFAKYVYAKGDEVAASNLSDQDRLTKDASGNEWIDYQDGNLKTETTAKELGVDKLKEKNDDSELYSMVNLPNVLLEKGDKVNVVDEGLGISRQYLVDTHLKRWTANGEFIQYTGLVRDDT